jgi:N-acetylglutamate synthase-like GNAT family acetyltransferase
MKQICFLSLASIVLVNSAWATNEVNKEIRSSTGEFITVYLTKQEESQVEKYVTFNLRDKKGNKIGMMRIMYGNIKFDDRLVILDLKNQTIGANGNKACLGVGRYLIKQAKSFADQQGLNTIFVTALFPNKVTEPKPLVNNPPDFFSKMGFFVESNSSDGAVMRLNKHSSN